MQLYLIRHTTPDVPPGVCYGQSEIGLTDSFAWEAQTIRDKLADIPFTACYSSPLQRCARLARELFAGEPRHDARLRELAFGQWELQPWQAIPQEEMERWSTDWVTLAPPGGESFAELHQRAGAFLHDLRQKHDGPVLAVTHSGVIRALLAEASGLPLTAVFRFRLDFGGVTRLDFNGTVPAVVTVNR